MTFETWRVVEIFTHSSNVIPVQIAELHFDVNDISKELCGLPSLLLSMGSYPAPSSPHYWQKEIDLVKARRESGLSFWQTHADVSLIKLLLSHCASQLPRVTAFVEDALALAQAHSSAAMRHALHSSRVKNSKRRDSCVLPFAPFISHTPYSLIQKIKKFREGGSDWGRSATAADVMDIIGARIVVADLHTLCGVRRSAFHPNL